MSSVYSHTCVSCRQPSASSRLRPPKQQLSMSVVPCRRLGVTVRCRPLTIMVGRAPVPCPRIAVYYSTCRFCMSRRMRVGVSPPQLEPCVVPQMAAANVDARAPPSCPASAAQAQLRLDMDLRFPTGPCRRSKGRYMARAALAAAAPALHAGHAVQQSKRVASIASCALRAIR